MNGGDFDITNIPLLTPESGADVALPATFTWQRRGIAGDTYRWSLFDLTTSDAWVSGCLGDADAFTLTTLPEGASYGTEYGWFVRVHAGADSWGESFYYHGITLSESGAASRESEHGDGVAVQRWSQGHQQPRKHRR